MVRRMVDLPTAIGRLQHWYVGRSRREMSGCLDVEREAPPCCVTPVAAPRIVRGGRANHQRGLAGLVRGWLPTLADTRLGRVTWPGISEHRQFVAHQIESEVPIIWQPLRNEHGLAVRAASLSCHALPSVRSRLWSASRQTISPGCGHPCAWTTLRGGRDQLRHPVPRLPELKDEDNQA
jgi:hypothetical protein